MERSNTDKRRRFRARCIAPLCACILCGVQTVSAGDGNLYGLVHWDGQQTTNKGLAILPTEANKWTGAMEYVWKIPTYPYNYGGCHFEDKFYCNYLTILRLFFNNQLTARQNQMYNPLKIFSLA